MIIQNWLDVVNDNDIVINLGDVIFGNAYELKNILHSLPGKKILVRGNHDKHTNQWYLLSGFDVVCKSYEYKNVVFTHKPVDMVTYHNKNVLYNIHGHSHSKLPDKKSLPFYSESNIRISIELENYKMITLTEIMSRQ